MRTMIWLGMFLGGAAGGYVPVLMGSDLFSLASLAGNTIGGVLGVLGGYRLARYYGL